jgi:hypothetical protein
VTRLQLGGEARPRSAGTDDDDTQAGTGTLGRRAHSVGTARLRGCSAVPECRAWVGMLAWRHYVARHGSAAVPSRVVPRRGWAARMAMHRLAPLGFTKKYIIWFLPSHEIV